MVRNLLLSMLVVSFTLLAHASDFELVGTFSWKSTNLEDKHWDFVFRSELAEAPKEVADAIGEMNLLYHAVQLVSVNPAYPLGFQLVGFARGIIEGKEYIVWLLYKEGDIAVSPTLIVADQGKTILLGGDSDEETEELSRITRIE